MIGSIQCTIGEMTEKGGHTLIKHVSDAVDNAHMNRRWVVTDSAGAEYPAYMMSMNSNSTAAGADYEVQTDLPAASVAGLRFQQRPYSKWVEVRNISLHPNLLTDVQVVSSDHAQPATRPQ